MVRENVGVRKSMRDVKAFNLHYFKVLFLICICITIVYCKCSVRLCEHFIGLQSCIFFLLLRDAYELDIYKKTYLVS